VGQGRWEWVNLLVSLHLHVSGDGLQIARVTKLICHHYSVQLQESVAQDKHSSSLENSSNENDKIQMLRLTKIIQF
jgi:hypothetical protein